MTKLKGILIYGVGVVGCRVTRLSADMGYPVTAAVNRPGAKIGRRLSELAGATLDPDPIVRATLDEALEGSEADVALYSVSDGLAENMPLYRDLLTRGISVISCGLQASYPRVVSEAFAAELDHLARKHGAVFFGTGFQDVFRLWLPAVLAAASNRIERVMNRSLVDIALHGPGAAQLGGAGMSGEDFRSAMSRYGGITPYQVLIHQAVETIGLPVLSVTSSIEPVFAEKHYRRGGFEVAAGMTLGSRTVTKIVAGHGVEVTAVNDLRLALEGEEDFVEWEMAGPSPLTCRLTGYDAGLATVAQIVNRIPDVLAARPGLRSAADLGPARFRGGA
jgi:4-hydroxy-tetrahydrodipicolinate reductase